MSALAREEISVGLRDLGVSPVTLKHAFLGLSIEDTDVEDIAQIREFPHLQDVSITGCKVKDVSPLGALPHLQSLDLSGNELEEVLDYKPDAFEDNGADYEFNVCWVSKLDRARLSSNKIGRIRPLDSHAFLRKLVLDHNEIEVIEGISALKCLEHLDLSYNKIKAIEGLDGLPLKHVSLGHNALRRITGLDKVPLLEVLLLDGNAIRSLRGLEACEALGELDVSGNAVGRVHEVEHLMHLTGLATLDLRGNPCAEADSCRLRCLKRLPGLDMLDGAATSAAEKVDACSFHGEDIDARHKNFKDALPDEPFILTIEPFVEGDGVLVGKGVGGTDTEVNAVVESLATSLVAEATRSARTSAAKTLSPRAVPSIAEGIVAAAMSEGKELVLSARSGK